MEVRKILRKATAVAASASFIGATMLGAVAQDLANYPAPFVKDGTFDAFIVVGADAQPSDVIGSVDIGASLQFALKKETTVSAGASQATIDQGTKIQKSGDKFNYEDSVQSVLAGTDLTQDDLPSTLADGKYVESEGDNKNSETYTQELRFNDATTAKLLFAQDDELAPKASDYLFVDKNTELYNYTFEFDSEVEYNNESSQDALDDLKTTTITIQGQTYTITDVTLEAGNLDKITLLSGEAVLWLTQNNPITKSVSGVEHVIEVLDVTENEDACQVKVDDVTAIVDEDETKTINGVQIGITDVRAIHAQLQDVDVCQVSIGASEVELQDGRKIKVDDVELDGTKAIIDGDGGEWNGFEVTFAPKEEDDDLYLSSGKEYIDPVFHSWKLVYGGLTTGTVETVSVKRSGSTDADIVFTNNDGKEVEIPMFLNDSNLAVTLGQGDNVDEALLVAGSAANGIVLGAGATALSIGQCNPASGSVEDCEGIQILASDANGEAHIFEVEDIDLEENQTDITDVTYNGRTFNDVDFFAQGVNTRLDLGSFGGINVTVTSDNFTVILSVVEKIETKNEGSLILNIAKANVTLFVNETDKDNEQEIADEQASSVIRVRALPDSSDEELDLFAAVTSTGTVYNVELEDDSDLDVLVTPVGTKITVNSEDDDSVVIEIPAEEVYGNVFVAPIVAQVSTAAGGIPTYTLSKLNVGAAKLDSEISDVGANNLIVVGGPCANRISAQVLGKTFPACGADSGIAAGTAIIKAVAQSSGKVALVVAGYDAVDTRRASRVLSNYDQYDLSGSEVVVTGTSLTDIQVKKSA
jgi:hypothetical protein